MTVTAPSDSDSGPPTRSSQEQLSKKTKMRKFQYSPPRFQRLPGKKNVICTQQQCTTANFAPFRPPGRRRQCNAVMAEQHEALGSPHCNH